jgi:hypothetical protein
MSQSPLHFQFERYDSDHVIGQVTLGIRQGNLVRDLLGPDGMRYRDFKRAGIFGSRLSDGTYVSRRRDADTYVAVRWNPANGKEERVSFTLVGIARAMEDGELFVDGGHGHKLFLAEQEMRRILKDDPALDGKMEMARRMDTTRRLPFLGIMVVAAQNGHDISDDEAREISLLGRDGLLDIGYAIENGTWTPAPAPSFTA